MAVSRWGSSAHAVDFERGEAEGAVRKQVKLRRKNNNERLWIYWPRSSTAAASDGDGVGAAASPRGAAAGQVTVHGQEEWEDEVERLQLEGWRPPSRSEKVRAAPHRDFVVAPSCCVV